MRGVNRPAARTWNDGYVLNLIFIEGFVDVCVNVVRLGLHLFVLIYVFEQFSESFVNICF